jgi:hypothetical protein
MYRSWMSALLGFSLILFVFSCQQDEVMQNQPSTVSFEVSPGMVGSNARVTDDHIEICDMNLADYVMVEVNSEMYKLPIKKWGQSFKTNLLELDPGIYTLTSFVVFDENDEPLFATPTSESLFEKFVDRALPIEFEVRSYEKLENQIDVLCIEDFTPPDFGFKFWNIDLKQVKYFCIFANYCEPEYGHKVAALEAFVYPNAEETTPNDLIWTESIQGAGELLCLTLPYDPDVPLVDQNYYIVLYINGIKYVAIIDLAFVDMINESEKGYLHLNENCMGDIDPFYRVGTVAWEDLVDQGNDMDYNDVVLGYKITGDGDVLNLDIKPLARGAGFNHRFELVFKKGEVLGATGVANVIDVDDKTIVVIYDNTHALFGQKFVNTECGGFTGDYPVDKITIDVSDDFVYYFDRPLNPCLHTVPGGDAVYNLFLWEWNVDGQSVFNIGDVHYPNGILTPHDWTQGVYWLWPIEQLSILDAYPDFEPIETWNPNWYMNIGTGLYDVDCP